jgi:hypothetical protein
MVASCAGAALGCYLVSLRVASERAAVESVESRIVLTQRDIRLLQTEIGTRGRLAQLERWNVKALALSAPSADQFLDGGFALAKMVAPQHNVDLEAPVVLASAPANGPRPQVEGIQQRHDRNQDEAGVSAKQMLYTASLTREIKPAESVVVAPRPSPAPAKPVADKAIAKSPPEATKPVTTAKAPAVAKSKPVTTAKAPAPAKSRPTKFAQADSTTQDDPLAPRPAKAGSHGTTKDSGSKQ